MNRPAAAPATKAAAAAVAAPTPTPGAGASEAAPPADPWLSVWGEPWAYSVEAGPDSVLPAEAAAAGVEGQALPRILRAYVIARAALALGLLLAPWATWLMGARPSAAAIVVSAGYAAQAWGWMVLWLRRERQAPPPDKLDAALWFWTMGVDLIAFAALRLLDSPGQFNYGALLVLPVLMSGVLTRRSMALFTACGVTLVLLAGAWPAGDHLGWNELGVAVSQAAMAGAGMLLISVLASELAQRLAREELSARSHLRLARQQTQLNRLVIDEMTDGVLVVDGQGRIRAINPAGRDLLGALARRLALPIAMAEEPGLAGLHRALQRAYQLGQWPEDEHEQVLRVAAGPAVSVLVRARFTRRAAERDGEAPEALCVLFLEDLRQLRARQSQDRLAAMGRMSAGIAHEIRNPLAAIAQANALLREEPLDAAQGRLATIVADNVQRLKRIVDDVLEAVPAQVDPNAQLDAQAEVAAICADWRRSATGGWHEPQRLALQLPGAALPVQFDAEHLRRVLVNLLDNAARHASGGPGSVSVVLAAPLAAQPAPEGLEAVWRPTPTGGWARLEVASDGEPITPEVERHLFEPFYSTRSRGSGLGLYICRELCERHGARIDHLPGAPGARHANRFVVLMKPAHRPGPLPSTAPTPVATASR